MRPTYPIIATLVNGQVLSAEHLKTYNAALEYLLAESHAPFPLGGAMPSAYTDDSPSDTPHTAWSGYTRHAGNALQYCFQVGENSDNAGQEYHAIIQYYGDDSAYHTVGTVSGEGSAYLTGAIDISSALMTAGCIYEWRVQVYGNDVGTHSADDYNVSYQHWWMAEYRSVSAASWKVPHTFTCAGTSSATHFNDWKTDLDLIEAVIPDMQWLTGNSIIQTNSDTDWHEGIFRGAYPYRPDRLYLGLQCALTGGSDWQWRAAITDTNGSSVVFYTSGTIAGTGARDWDTATVEIDPGTTAGSLITAEGITLTRGSYYRVRLDTKKLTSNAEELVAYAGYMMRLSDGIPAAADELITNGGFETAGTGAPDLFDTWGEITESGGSIVDDTTIFHGGAHSAKLIQGTAAQTYIGQTQAATGSTSYVLSFYTRGDGSSSGQYQVNDTSGCIVGRASTGVSGTTWTQVTCQFWTSASATTVSPLLFSPSLLTGGTAWFDDVSLMKGTWQTLPTWAHGDIDVGPTNLNIVSQDIPIFNTHGNEQLFGSNLITPAYTGDGITERNHTGVHRKRWLHYLPLSGTIDPSMHYGDHSESETLVAGTTWTSLDLETVDNLSYGMYYDVKNALCAYEADD